jgi:hypothetical protein
MDAQSARYILSHSVSTVESTFDPLSKSKVCFYIGSRGLTSLLDGTTDGDRTKLRGRELLQTAVEASDGGADSTDNDDLL